MQVLENGPIFKKWLKLHPENFDVQGGQIPEVEFFVGAKVDGKVDGSC